MPWKKNNWKNNIDDIKIVCKRCNQEMIMESTLDLVQGLYGCPGCGEHVTVAVYDFIPYELRRSDIENKIKV
jgi:hypothetical protein